MAVELTPMELPLKPKHLHPTAKKQKSTGSGSGPVGGKKHRVTNGMQAVMREQMKKEAADQTAANKKILVIDAKGKRHFMRLREYEATR